MGVACDSHFYSISIPFCKLLSMAALMPKVKKALKYLLITGLLLIAVIGIWGYASDLSVEELKEKYGQPPSQYLAMNGMEVHYRIEGQGDTLLLLHGTAASLHTWDRWAESLKSDFTIIRLDLPAFGLTGPHPEAKYSLEAYDSFVNDFMNALGAERFSIAGNSLGGAIAWHYAAQHPERMEKLILLDPSGLPKDGSTSLIFRLAKNPVSAALLKKLTPRSIIADNLKQVYHDDSKVTDELINRYRDMTRRTGNRQAFVDRANNTGGVDARALLESIQCPTLIQWGRHDTWIPVSDAALFESYIANSRSIIYENAGHVPMEEIPKETAADVRKFLLE